MSPEDRRSSHIAGATGAFVGVVAVLDVVFGVAEGWAMFIGLVIALVSHRALAAECERRERERQSR